MLPNRAPPAKRTPLKISAIQPAADRKKLFVAGVAAALQLTESQVRMRVHRKQWRLIPQPEATRELGGKFFWYEDNVMVFKKAKR